MGRRYAPVPDEAADLCRDAAEIAAVYLLYRRAHDRRWRSMPLSIRDVMALSGLTQWAARRLLSALEAEGLIAWTRAASGGVGGVEVYDPQLAQEVTREVTQEVTRSDPEQSSTIRQSPHGAPHGAPHGSATGSNSGTSVQPRISRPSDHDPDHDPDHDHDATRAAPPSDVYLAVAEALASSQRREIVGMFAQLTPREVGAIREAVTRRGVTAEEIRLVGEWVEGCRDDDAAWIQDKGKGWTVILGDAWVSRLRQARAWDDRGRVGVSRSAKADPLGADDFLARILAEPD